MMLNHVDKCLSSGYYFSNFVSDAEEEKLLQNIYAVPKPKWVTLSKRRLQNWGGTPHSKGMIAEPLPIWIHPYIDKLMDMTVFDSCHVPNHILINEYLPGQGIMPHTDGPYYHPVVATISLGCHTFLDFYRPVSRDGEFKDDDVSLESRFLFSFLLERRSLVVLTEEMYKSCLHGIAERDFDAVNIPKLANFDFISDSLKETIRSNENSTLCREDTRISLTIRNVPNTIKLKTNIFGKV